MKLNITARDGKPIEISPAETRALARFGLVVFVGIFCLFGLKTLVSKALYQQKVISAGHKALNQLNSDLSAASSLSSEYSTLFENSNPSNMLGGRNDSTAGAVPPNVDNARLALDALPTTYDYPALLASVSKLLANNNIHSPSIVGSDQTTSVNSTPSANPQPAPITLSITGAGTTTTVQSFFRDLERSIRPFDVTGLHLSGSDGGLSFSVNVNTYFQPAKVLGITEDKVQ